MTLYKNHPRRHFSMDWLRVKNTRAQMVEIADLCRVILIYQVGGLCTVRSVAIGPYFSVCIDHTGAGV